MCGLDLDLAIADLSAARQNVEQESPRWMAGQRGVPPVIERELRLVSLGPKLADEARGLDVAHILVVCVIDDAREQRAGDPDGERCLDEGRAVRRHDFAHVRREHRQTIR